MANAFSKSMSIQILLSVSLILFGVVAIYLMHRARSGPTQITFRDLDDGAAAVESEQAGSMFYTGSPGSRAGMLVSPEDEPHKTQELRHETRDQRYESPRSEVLSLESMTEQLQKLKYDGYMRVGDMRIAWLSDGKDRIAVAEGNMLDDNIRVDKIHENSLLVSAAQAFEKGLRASAPRDGRIVQEIPFTRSPDGLRDAGTGGQEGRDDRTRVQSREATSRVRDSEQSRPSVSTAPQDGRIMMYVEPAPKAVKSVGETFTVQVRIDNGLNVFAVPFDVNYNPGVLEVTGLHEGSYLKKDGGQTTFLTSIDRNKGRITVGLTRLGRIGGVSGSGTLMSIDFRALKSGATFLSFANGRPMDSNLNALPVEFTHGEVKVE